MKKLILALIALAFAFAISSCCDQSYCPGNIRCDDQQGQEKSYRWDQQDQQMRPGQQQERQHRRW